MMKNKIEYSRIFDNYNMVIDSNERDINVEVNKALELIIEEIDKEGNVKSRRGIPLDYSFYNRIKKIEVNYMLMETMHYHKLTFSMKENNISIVNI